MLSVNTTFESALLGALAREAAQRCEGDGASDAIGAVILAYAAFEAFVNEFAQLAETTDFEASQLPEHPARRVHSESLLALLQPFVHAIRTAQE